MNIYVINLPKDIHRKTFQKEQLSSLGLHAAFIDASTPQTLGEQLLDAHRDDWQRPLRDVEIACYYSHHFLWEKILTENTPALILEDDALLSQKLPCFLDAISTLNDIDFINLESVGRKKIVSKNATFTQCDTSLFKLYLDRNGTGGYVLFPSGAKKLLEFAQHSIGLADAHIRSCPNLRVYQAEPILVIQLDQCHKVGLTPPIEAPSNITDTHKPPPLAKKQYSFKIKRIKEQLRQGVLHLRHILSATKREITIIKKDYTL